MIRPIVEAPTLKDFRRGLIATFVERQTVSRKYLSLKDDVAAFMANNRAQGDDGAAALEELMRHASVGAFDGEGAPLLLMRDTVAVECLDIVQSDICQSFCCGSIPLVPALIASGDLKEMRGVGANGSMESSLGVLHVAMSGDAIVMSQVMPFCWARRETVVALLRKQGIGEDRMRAAWYPGDVQEDSQPAVIEIERYPTRYDPPLSAKPAVALEMLRRLKPSGWPRGTSAGVIARLATTELNNLGLERFNDHGKLITKFNDTDIKRALGRRVRKSSLPVSGSRAIIGQTT
jgi:hypothetical protein